MGGPGDLGGELAGRLEGLAVVDHGLGEAGAEELVGTQGSVPQHEGDGPGGAEGAGEEVGDPAVGRGADAEVARDELGRAGRDPEVGREGEAHAGAHRRALERGDDRERQRPDLADQGVQRVDQAAQHGLGVALEGAPDEREVGAGAEGPVRAGQHRDPGARRDQLVEPPVERLEQLDVHRVLDLGPGEEDLPDAVLDRQLHRHGDPP
ncbi:MAG: hypothetical protein M5U14_09115 [Acidimicrobiia bacterium]|nr:hypothetical protein [Acidimicrobiia bacterium]